MRTGDPTVLERANGGRGRSLLVGVLAAVVAAAFVAGLLWIGAPLSLPFVAVVVSAIVAWLAGRRAVAVGIVLGTLAWSAFIVSVLLAMGDSMEGFD